ncbi:unnamed protein product [Chrysoparadoxa australica]
MKWGACLILYTSLSTLVPVAKAFFSHSPTGSVVVAGVVRRTIRSRAAAITLSTRSCHREEEASMTRTAQIIPASTEGLQEAGQVLRSGGLVAFPTETVYGLGANALNEAAVMSIFEAKGRPLTDPLIVHIADDASAECIIDINSTETLQLFRHLAAQFWPGPLTLIVRACSSLPLCVTASTGFVGVRCPNHPIALGLLKAAAVPVCAPSANRFGHVSPTSAAHVLDDLGSQPIAVLDDSKGEGVVESHAPAQDSSSTCCIGIESTVARLESDCITILRPGAVTMVDLEASLSKAFPEVKVTTRQLKGGHQETPEERKCSEEQPQEAPGQLLRHYAPDVDTVCITTAAGYTPSPEMVQSMATKCVVLDFARQLHWLKGASLAYRDLSEDGSASEAAAVLFESLRWAENVSGVTRILVARCPEDSSSDSLAAAVNDRIGRATNGLTEHYQ